jgi:hypothetical protein
MKKIISASTIIVCSILFFTPYSYGQNSKRAAREINTDNNQGDDETEVPSENIRPKKSHTYHHTGNPIVIGIAGGLNFSDLVYGNGDGYGLRTGGTLGVLLDAHIGGRFYFQPGLFYASTGGSGFIHDGHTYNNDKVYLNTLDVPLSLVYKFGHSSTHFYLGLTAFVGYNFSGTYSDASGSGSLKIGSSSTNDIKAVDIGAGINLGVELKSGLFFNLKDREGLSDLTPDGLGTSTPIRSSSGSLTIGYFFGRQGAHRRVRGRDDRYLERKM